MRRVSIGLIAAVLSTGLGASFAAPDAKARDSATLSVVNPPSDINGMKIKRVVVTLDGDKIGECFLDRPLKNDVCTEPTDIEAGPHKVEIILDPFKQTFFRADTAFTAGLRDAWVLDLGKMILPDAKPSDYLVALQLHIPPTGCVGAVERIAATPSCRSDQLGALFQAFADASKACRNVSGVDQVALAKAVRQAEDVHFDLALSQCYDGRQMKRLPGRIVDSWLPPDSDAWPPRSVTTSSWQWARDVLASKPRSDDPLDRLDAAAPALARLAARLEVVDSVITAYLDKDPQPVLRAAESAPFSLDPTTPAGHRNILVLTDPHFFYDDTYLKFVAAQVAADTNLDCSRYRWEAERITRYFTERTTLPAAAWRAVAAMMERAPSDGRFDACAAAFDPTRESPVSAAERLRHLANLDCAAGRPADLRGRMLRGLMSRDGNRPTGIDDDLRSQLEHEFASCLAAN